MSDTYDTITALDLWLRETPTGRRDILIYADVDKIIVSVGGVGEPVNQDTTRQVWCPPKDVSGASLADALIAALALTQEAAQ